MTLTTTTKEKVIALCNHNLDGILEVYLIHDYGDSFDYVHIYTNNGYYTNIPKSWIIYE